MEKWERETADASGKCKTWGLRDSVLESLLEHPTPAMREIHTRLTRLYPDFNIAHMPAELMHAAPTAAAAAATSAAGPAGPREMGRGAAESGAEPDQAVICAHFVGNAPVHGDEYSWHIDADPASLPECSWTAAFGDYVNGEPGQPLLVSLLLYLDDAWPRDWGAETLFLDAEVGAPDAASTMKALKSAVWHQIVASLA